MVAVEGAQVAPYHLRLYRVGGLAPQPLAQLSELVQGPARVLPCRIACVHMG